MKTLKKKVLYDVVSLLAYTIVYVIIIFVFYIFVWNNLEFIRNSIIVGSGIFIFYLSKLISDLLDLYIKVLNKREKEKLKATSAIKEKKKIIHKYVFITNGMARSGKDTFAQILNKYIPTKKISSITPVKNIALLCGWNGAKEEKDRKFLSDLKRLLIEYNDMPFHSTEKAINDFLFNDNEHEVLLIDIREPEEIDKVVKAHNAITIFIQNDRVKNVVSNLSDANVYNYTYDYIIKNNGTLEEFEQNIVKFYHSAIDPNLLKDSDK